MIGVLYLLMALGCWTVWAVLSTRLGLRFSPLNSILWTGVVYAAITAGGFVIHHRQVRLPSGNEWWLLAIFCVASTLASFAYYAALRHLPGTLVLPLSHLYLVFGPLLIALLERRAMTGQQLGSLCLVVVGMVLFLAASPETGRRSSPQSVSAKSPEPARPQQRAVSVSPLPTYDLKTLAHRWPRPAREEFLSN
ncbi:MAG TPA: DMT family transporter [Bacillota bacterium]|nr:DMT family transporter [Bacillota bacterium]